MSRISDLLEARITGRRASKDLKYVDPYIAIDNQSGVLDCYKVGLTIQNSVWVDSTVKSTENGSLQDAINASKKAIIEEIFGEFRPILYELRLATYDRDISKVRELLSDLDKRMFGE